jgi:hypothetical protein
MSTVQGGQGNIVTNGLVLNLDAANPRSYPQPYNGTTWTDLSGNGNNGTLVSGSFYTGSNGGSIVFDGVNDYTMIGDASNLITSTQTSITVSAWVKSNVINTYKKIITSTISGTSTITGIYLSIGPSFDNSNTYFGVRTSNGTRSAIYLTNISTVNFSHLVGVYNGSNIILYLNGNQVATQTQTGIINNNGIMRISGYDSGTEIWNGNIAQTSIYNRALNPSEVLQNFNATRARFGI